MLLASQPKYGSGMLSQLPMGRLEIVNPQSSHHRSTGEAGESVGHRRVEVFWPLVVCERFGGQRNERILTPRVTGCSQFTVPRMMAVPQPND
jgi:hypothetical protein